MESSESGENKQTSEGKESLWSIRSRFPRLIIFVFLGSVIVGIPAYYYFQSLRTVVQPRPAPPTTSRPTPVGAPPLKSAIPTLDRISKCAAGTFPEAPIIPEIAHKNDQPFGLIVEKGSSGQLSISVQEVFNGKLVDVDLSGVDEIYFREVFDRERYVKGESTSFSQVIMKGGQPYGIKDVYPYLTIGTHVWYWEESDVGSKVLWIYCDAL